MLYREVWFWLMVVGGVVLASSIILLVFSPNNKTLGYIALAAGLLLIIAGILYLIFRKSTDTTAAVLEQDILSRGLLGEKVTEEAKKFNMETSDYVQQYIDRNAKYLDELQRGVGRSAGTLVKFGARNVRAALAI